jgi:hypothetical protein
MGARLDQGECGEPLGMTGGARGHRIDDQAVRLSISP